ncbi:MAG: DNA recombination protein RmuC [Vampirovibrionales bacterium]|nr:DNA recombination protein RmuC [Vampirovibrionales bacterium]
MTELWMTALLAAIASATLMAIALWQGVVSPKAKTHDAEKTQWQQEKQAFQQAVNSAQSAQAIAESRLEEAQRQANDFSHRLETLQQTHQSILSEKASLDTELALVREQQQAAMIQWQTQVEAFVLQQGELLKQSLETKADREFKEQQAQFKEQVTLQITTHMGQLVQPLAETLHQYQKNVLELDKTHNSQTALIGDVRQELKRVAGALSSNKGRGDWGELQLVRLLESSGLIEGEGFVTQQAFEGGKKRPDVRILLPGGRNVFIDAKALQVDVMAEPEDSLTLEQRKARQQRYAQSLKEATKLLSSKEYQQTLESSADFVVLYVPQESMLSLALLEDPELMQDAWKRGVMLAGPLNLMAMLRLVHHSMRMEALSKDAQQILTMGTKLYSQACTVAERLGKVGSAIETLTKAYNQTATAWDGQQGLVRQIGKLKDYGCDAGKQLPQDLYIPETSPMLSTSGV